MDQCDERDRRASSKDDFAFGLASVVTLFQIGGSTARDLHNPLIQSPAFSDRSMLAQLAPEPENLIVDPKAYLRRSLTARLGE